MTNLSVFHCIVWGGGQLSKILYHSRSLYIWLPIGQHKYYLTGGVLISHTFYSISPFALTSEISLKQPFMHTKNLFYIGYILFLGEPLSCFFLKGIPVTCKSKHTSDCFQKNCIFFFKLIPNKQFAYPVKAHFSLPWGLGK